MPSLNDILGQPQALDTLRASLSSGRIHHAWIFSGPMGVGKFTAACAFASILLDPTSAPTFSGDIEPEPGSPTQQMIAAGTHPDLHIITKELALFSDEASVRKNKQITIAKDIIEHHLLEPIARAASIRTTSLAQKVFIVDEAELMDRSKSNATTQNAMLKTLEEPPPGSVIILVTSREDRLLTTIRSRCQRVAFRRLDKASMDQWFKPALKNLDRTVDSVEKHWVDDFAAGSPGLALLALQTGLFEWSLKLNPLLDDADRGKFPIDLGSTMSKLAGAWAEAWVDSHKNASKEAANHAAVRHLAALLGDRYRRKLRDAAARSDESALNKAAKAIDTIADAERHIGANVNMGHALENLAAQLVVA